MRKMAARVQYGSSLVCGTVAEVILHINAASNPKMSKSSTFEIFRHGIPNEYYWVCEFHIF
jgi:hypothetical protein